MLTSLTTPGFQRPAWPYQANRASPLARGLVSLHAHMGDTAVDLVSGAPATWNAKPTLAAVPNFRTAAATVAASSQDFEFPCPPALSGSSYGTIMFWCVRNANADELTVAAWPNGVSASRFMLQWATDGKLYGQVETGSGAPGMNISLPASNRGVYQLMMTFNGTIGEATNRVDFYVNGTLNTTSKTVTGSSPGTVLASGMNRLAWQRSYYSSDSYATGIVISAALWARALTATEAWMLYDPRTRWDLYRVPSRRLWVKAPAGGGASVLPRIMQQHGLFIGGHG